MDRARTSGRRGARYGAVQAIYRWLMNPVPAGEVLAETRDWEHLDQANRAMLRELVDGTIERAEALDRHIAGSIDRPVCQLDPMEHAVLLVATYELVECPELSRRIVINEAIELSKLFGASEAHKYVNGVLDRLARDLRPHETT